MFTISDYLNQLHEDKDTLYTALINANVVATQTETFTTLTPKVNDITLNIQADLKPVINLTGAGITDEPLDEYPSILEESLLDIWNNGSDVIFENYPNKETKEGTSFTIYNTINAKMKINLKGNTTQNGTPTPSNPVAIKTVKQENHINKTGSSSDSYFISLPVENKFESISTNTIDGITLTNNGDESYLLNGTAESSSIMFTKNVNLPAGTYTIKANNGSADSKVRIRLESANGSINTLTCNNTYQTSVFGITDRVTSISIWCTNTPTLNNFYLRPEIIIKGYEGIELCKIGDYQDYIYKQNNNWYIHKEIGKLVLNGSENWNKSTTSDSNYRYYVENFLYAIADIGLCSYYSLGIFNQRNNEGQSGKFFIGGTNSLQFVNNISEVADFKTWLSTHKTVVYYVLTNSYNTQITDQTLLNQLYSLENAKSNEGNTTLVSYSVNNQEVLYLNATALKEESNNG